ncbi:MAG: hypothetical protein ACJ780_19310 [Solirubrobacteraceae bacterium]|jgi:hypothetical protein
MPSLPREPDERAPDPSLSPGWDELFPHPRLTPYAQERLWREVWAWLLSPLPDELDDALPSRTEPSPAVELTPAQKARARAKHARRIAFEQAEAES